MSDYIDELNEFLGNKCTMPGHWCNGDVIPAAGRKFQQRLHLEDQRPCKFYDRQKGCLHPNHPKYNKKMGAIRN